MCIRNAVDKEYDDDGGDGDDDDDDDARVVAALRVRRSETARATETKRVAPLEGARVTAEQSGGCDGAVVGTPRLFSRTPRRGGRSDARQSDEQVEEEDRGTVGGASGR